MKNLSCKDSDLRACYRKYKCDHELLRRQLVSSLPSVEWSGRSAITSSRRLAPKASGLKLSFAWRAGLAAAAAVIAVTVGLIHLAGVGPGSFEGQAAWAAALDQTSRVQSMHLVVTTPTNGKDVRLEIWWRRPHDYRLEFDDQVITNNEQNRCVWNRQSDELKVFAPEEHDQDVAVLGWFGQLFTSDKAVAQGLLSKTPLVGTEKVNYKGEQYQKLIFEDESLRSEVIVDPESHLIYERIVYAKGRADTMVEHREVLEIDQVMSERLFTIEPRAVKTKN